MKKRGYLPSLAFFSNSNTWDIPTGSRGGISVYGEALTAYVKRVIVKKKSQRKYASLWLQFHQKNTQIKTITSGSLNNLFFCVFWLRWGAALSFSIQLKNEPPHSIQNPWQSLATFYSGLQQTFLCENQYNCGLKIDKRVIVHLMGDSCLTLLVFARYGFGPFLVWIWTVFFSFSSFLQAKNIAITNRKLALYPPWKS